MSSDGVVVDEAVRAAWDTYRVLEKRTPAEERQQAQQRVKDVMDSVGREEVSRGTVFLVGVLTGYLIAEPPGGGEQLDPLNDLIPAVIRRLPSFEMADPEQVPMVTGVLMAAAMGMDTVAWRDRFGTIGPKETMVHASCSTASPTASTTSYVTRPQSTRRRKNHLATGAGTQRGSEELTGCRTNCRQVASRHGVRAGPCGRGEAPARRGRQGRTPRGRGAAGGPGDGRALDWRDSP
ncbi:hypothetical protein [Streptomyces sp. NPDC026589]|uniref:hypothetical protein n=1 Tax=Streptomyces sp. NPDC026589 TaxID=3155609 RepID=UPI0033E45C1A